MKRAAMMPPPSLTARQAQVLMLVISGVHTHVALANALGVASTHAISCHLTALRRKGYVTWERGKHGTLVATVPEVS